LNKEADSAKLLSYWEGNNRHRGVSQMLTFRSRFFLSTLFFLFSGVSFGQNQNKVVVIPLDSTRPAIEVVDNNGLTVGAATATDYVAMKSDPTLRERSVFLAPISREGFFIPDASNAGVFYTGNGCTGTAFTGRQPRVFQIASIGFDPNEGPHQLNVGISEIQAFIHSDPDSPGNLVSSSASAFDSTSGTWRCIGIIGIFLATYELGIVADLSGFQPPYSARSQ